MLPIPSAPRNSACCFAPSSTSTPTPSPTTWPRRSRAQTRTTSARAEEVLLAAIDGLGDEKLTGFALRLALTSHVAIPREGEADFLTEAEAVFLHSQPKKSNGKKAPKSTPTKAAPKKPTAKKKTAA